MAFFPDYEALGLVEAKMTRPERHPLRQDGRSAYSCEYMVLGTEWLKYPVAFFSNLSYDITEEPGADSEVVRRFHVTSFKNCVSILEMGGIFLAGPNGHSGRYGLFTTGSLGEAWMRGDFDRSFREAQRFHPSMLPVVAEVMIRNTSLRRYTSRFGPRVTHGRPGQAVQGVFCVAVHINENAARNFWAFGQHLRSNRLTYGGSDVRKCFNFPRCGRWLSPTEPWPRSNKGHLYCWNCYDFCCTATKTDVLVVELQP